MLCMMIAMLDSQKWCQNFAQLLREMREDFKLTLLHSGYFLTWNNKHTGEKRGETNIFTSKYLTTKTSDKVCLRFNLLMAKSTVSLKVFIDTGRAEDTEQVPLSLEEVNSSHWTLIYADLPHLDKDESFKVWK